MSERGNLAMSSEEVEAFLAAEHRAQLGTINADGTPHVVPLSYVVIEGRVTFWTGPRSRKIVNLRRDPRLSCLVEAGAHFAEFRAVQLNGRAVLSDDRASSERAGLALFARANGGTLTDRLRSIVDGLVDERVAVAVEPERVVTWDHRKMPGVRPADVGT